MLHKTIQLSCIIVLHTFIGCTVQKNHTVTNTHENLVYYSQQELQEDFLQLESTLLKKNPFLFSDKKTVKRAFSQKYRLIKDQMSEHEFYQIVAPLVAQVQCGHTALSISNGYENYLKKHAQLLPLDLYIENHSQLYVEENSELNAITPGSEIISIDGIPAEEILQTLYAAIPSDGSNSSKKSYILDRWFPLYYYHFISQKEASDIVLRSPSSNSVSTVTVRSRRMPQAVTTAWKLHFADLDTKLLSSNITEKYAYLRIKLFAFMNKQEYKNSLKIFFAGIKKKDKKNLIIDLRGNWGGDPFYASELLMYLGEKPVVFYKRPAPFLFSIVYSDLLKPKAKSENHFSGKIYCIMDGACFSTSGHFLSLFKHYKLGTLIGEKSATNGMCSDSAIDVTLKNTGMRLHCSTQIYKTSAYNRENKSGISPDKKITYSIQDKLSGKDKEMEYITHLIDLDD